MNDYIRTQMSPDVPVIVLDLFAGCKALEDSDGSWSGGDVVQWVSDFLARYGVDPEKPLSHYVREAKWNDVLYPGLVPTDSVMRSNFEAAMEREIENGG